MKISVQVTDVRWDVPAWKAYGLPRSCTRLDVHVPNLSQAAVTEAVVRRLEADIREPVEFVEYRSFPRGISGGEAC